MNNDDMIKDIFMKLLDTYIFTIVSTYIHGILNTKALIKATTKQTIYFLYFFHLERD